MLYFAYGSNMDRVRMNSRGTDWEFVSKAILKDYTLTFNKLAQKNYTYTRSGSPSEYLYPGMYSMKGAVLNKSVNYSENIKYVASRRKDAVAPVVEEPKEGYGNVIVNDNTIVEGALYVVPASGIAALDGFEGHPIHYSRE